MILKKLIQTILLGFIICSVTLVDIGETQSFAAIRQLEKASGQPLTLTNSLGNILTATDSSNDIFTDSFDPQPNVGQYNLQPLLSQLQAEIPLKLSLPIIGDEAISLSVPPSFVQEWRTVGNYR